jgi:tRNA(Ile)-lysidine synthetase-like protein
MNEIDRKKYFSETIMSVQLLGRYQNEINNVLEFWFKKEFNVFRPQWFSSEWDKTIRTTFGDLHRAVENRERDDWKTTPYGKLAYIIVLDQFTRNLDRDREQETFRRNDQQVLELVEDMIEKREDLYYSTMAERMFILLPLRHSRCSRHIRAVLHLLDEYNMENKGAVFKSILERFRLATIHDLTKCDDDTIVSIPDAEKKEVDREQYGDILDSSYSNREVMDTNDLLEQVKGYLTKYNIKKAGVSLSGGIDSMVVLDILVDLVGNENVFAVHVCHSNREEAIQELEFLLKWCNYKKIHLLYRKVDYMNRETVDREVYEKETYDIRFGLYRKAIKDYNLDGMCLGHHRDDIGENVMMNILQRRDVLELKGMSDRKETSGVVILRPLLAVKKNVVWGYGHMHNIPCFLDSTPDWSWRGVLRRQVYPILDKRIGSIHTVLSDLGDKSEEWRIIMEKMVFQPIYDSIYYTKYGARIRLTQSAFEMPSTFYTKLLVHVFHKMSVRMTSVKNLQAMLEWVREKSGCDPKGKSGCNPLGKSGCNPLGKKETRFRFSNGYTGVRVDTDLYLLMDHLLEKNNWIYEVISVEELQKKACTWNDLLEGRYEYTLTGYVEEVRVFSKSDPIRKLFKGFEFLPKVTVHNSLPKVTVHNSLPKVTSIISLPKVTSIISLPKVTAYRIIIRVK